MVQGRSRRAERRGGEVVVGGDGAIVGGDETVGPLVEGGSGVPGRDAWDPPEGVGAPSAFFRG